MALKPNEIEAHALLNGGEGGGDLFADGLAGTLATELGVSSVVVTLGESGCVAQAAGSSEDGGCRHDRRHRRVHATFAADLTAGEPVAGAIHAAESAATWAIGQAGGHESVRRRVERAR